MLELDLNLTAREALDECSRRGLVVRSERELAGRPGSHHWHLGIPGRPGTLELNEWRNRVWVNVHPLRDGGWAVELAHELSTRRSRPVPHPGSGPPGRGGGLDHARHIRSGQRAVIVEREDAAVMFKRGPDEQQAITRAWAELEDVVGSLRGRKFYGVFYEERDEYRACVQLRESDDPEALGLETGTLPGGRYARVRLQGEPPAVYALIAPTFENLAQRGDRDPARPGIEFYRRRDVIDLLLPVA